MTAETEFRPEARAPRGLGDRRGIELRAERRLLLAVSEVYERWGFEPLETSALEYADALGKFLPDSERPNAGVFALQDDDEQWMALRYDHTAPLARYAAQNWTTLPKPFRRYAYGPVFRNEKAGPGRFREFVQCDADTVGSARSEADAEMVAMAVEGLEAAGLAAGSAVIKINNRKLLNGLLSAAGVSSDTQKLAVLRAVDKLDRLGADGVRLLLGEGRKDESGDFTRGAGLTGSGIEAVLRFIRAGRATRGETLDSLAEAIGGSEEGDQGLKELAAMDMALNSLGVAEDRARFDPSVVRGLEYYTGPVFEAELLVETRDEKGAKIQFGAIGGGGRYDDLVSRFGGDPAPATGFSFGVSRLVSALAAAGEARRETRGPVVVIVFDASHMADYLGCARELRQAGIAAEVYLGGSGMRAQMKYADRRLAPAVVMVGEDERAAGTVTIKDLDLGRALAEDVADHQRWRSERPGQATVPRAAMVPFIQRILKEDA